MTADTCDVTGYDAVVYDLDGTVVRLAVDWDATAREAVRVFADHGVEADGDLWAMLDLADERGLRDEIEAVLVDHEREGARTSERLPLADCLSGHSIPVGICSLNCEAACREALAAHDLTDAVRAVVGRDSVATRKPNPEPLLATVDRLGLTGDDPVLFVGDSRRDEETARRAGIDFRYVDGGPSEF
ncbi:HAD family hydrolase [Salinirubrum litoreum]|uniref:HAD family hydrolase n=1 Tax=Salinirubrum litoreum TaxID=1126234 RepID=A0ABD5R6B3_9EURY